MDDKKKSALKETAVKGGSGVVIGYGVGKWLPTDGDGMVKLINALTALNHTDRMFLLMAGGLIVTVCCLVWALRTATVRRQSEVDSFRYLADRALAQTEGELREIKNSLSALTSKKGGKAV